ncbi:hypothetical protein DFP73DRAFT_285478 [Morchella snyderi]|nr:hypothetical protein DFP73DRAFT_285478 [Morchella snyderi]
MPLYSRTARHKMWLINELNHQLSVTQHTQRCADKHMSALRQLAAMVEALAARLAEGHVEARIMRGRSSADTGADARTWSIKAERALLTAEVSKIRKEVEWAREWAGRIWAEAQRQDKEMGRLAKQALQMLDGQELVRAEGERMRKERVNNGVKTRQTSAEVRMGMVLARMKEEMMGLMLEMERMRDERSRKRADASRSIAESQRLRKERERLRVEVARVITMAHTEWQHVARD